MRYAMVMLLLLVGPGRSFAQEPLHDVAWDMLPDSLFLVWNLEQDQVKRLHVIEEDYNVDRSDLMNDKRLNAAEKEVHLRKMATARIKEIKGVLQQEYFIDWQHRLHPEIKGPLR